MFIVFTFKFNNKADEFIDEVLGEERDLQDSNQKSKTYKKETPMSEKEKRGIYNVTLNDKNSTPILKDIEAIEDVVIEYARDYVFYYVKGFHNPYRDRGLAQNISKWSNTSR